MIKKLLIVVAVLLAGGWLWAKTDLGSYAKTAWKQVRGCVKTQVPVEFEIKRAKDMIQSLDQEGENLISVMAEQMTAIKNLEAQIETGQARLKLDEKDIKTANDELKSSKTVFTTFLGETSRGQYAVDLQRRFNRYQALEAAVASQKETLKTHQEILAAAKEQFESIRASKAELQARIEKAETELHDVKAKEARAKHPTKFDDSELAKVKSLVDDIENKITTRRYEVELRDGRRPTVVKPVHQVSPDLTRDIDSHFNNGKAEEATASGK